MSFSMEQNQDADGRITLSLRGRLSYVSQGAFSPIVNAALSDPGTSSVILDMQSLDYMDSSGIGMLIVAAQSAKKKNIPLRAENVHGVVRKLLEMSNIGAIVEWSAQS